VRVPLSWLQEFAPFGDDWRELAAALDSLGLVVEGVDQVGSALAEVRTARVAGIEPISGADRIRRVVVDRGDAVVDVVCGAWNFEVGDVVAYAPLGTELPGGLRIERRKLRGVISEGMLCSPRELDLGDDHGGILVLDHATPVGVPLGEALGIHAEVVLDVAVETNRPDALCVAGIARDLAARLRLPWTLPAVPDLAPGPRRAAELAAIEVVDLDLCPRFTGHVLEGVTVGPSPSWLQRRLTLAGMRPINNVVDASNYVMLELGQPTHPYDLDRLAGRALRVRAARPGEQVVTLDGVTRTMGSRSVAPGDDRRDCLICDGHDVPVAIAGIMGGASTEISASTTTVLLEAAYFDPMAVARTSKRLGLRTEASARFERGCDPEGIDRAVARLVALMGESVPGMAVATGTLDVRGSVPAPVEVAVRLGRINAVLGTDLDAATVTGYLEPIGFACRRDGDGTLAVTVPTFRPDTTREIDVIEEVARHHGYGRIARRRLRPPQVGGLDARQRQRRALRQVMAGLGADEAWTGSLLAAADDTAIGLDGPGVRLANPQTPEEAVLRRSLLPGLLRAVARNLARRVEDVRLFEIGRVFPPPSAERVAAALRHDDPTVTPVDEREVLGLVLATPTDDATTAVGAWCRLAEALGLHHVELHQPSPGDRLPASLVGLHQGRAAELRTVRGELVGTVGEVDAEVAARFAITGRRLGWLEVTLDHLAPPTVASGSDGGSSALALPSRFPTSDVDLAFVVAGDCAADAIRATLATAGGPLLQTVVLFDAYLLPEGRRSLTYRLRFGADDRTLTDGDIGQLRQACVEAVCAAHDAVLR